MSAQLSLDGGSRTTAAISADRRYRYSLHRLWNPPAGLVNFIGLNPSTADEHTDDPTIRRCIGFARAWGYGGVVMTNLYAYRSTDPNSLRMVDDPVGNPANDNAICELAEACKLIVLAWGATPQPQPDRADIVCRLLGCLELHVLGLTIGGSPRHPLYMRGDCVPRYWSSFGRRQT